jgi:hypothetical protein
VNQNAPRERATREPSASPGADDPTRSRAQEALAHFQTCHRFDGAESYRLHAGAPQWVAELVYAAHRNGEIMPDDWRYRFTREALRAVSGDERQAAGDGACDERGDEAVSQLMLVAWLGSNVMRLEYCDEVLHDAVTRADMATVLAEGYRHEQDEVRGVVRDALRT